MIGGTNGSTGMINFNSAAWANQANAQLQQALQQGLQYSEKYTQQAVNAAQQYNQVAQTQQNQGYQEAQARNAPQQLATYNALDKYQGLLGMPTPVGGSFALSGALQNQVSGSPNTAQQQQQAAGFNQGVLSGIPQQGGY
jgi:hypothetical protein